MKAISKLRFDSLAGYSRTWWMPFVVAELGWFEEAEERILGVLTFDRSDEDYACYVLGRDARNRFRAVAVDCSITTQSEAMAKLEQMLTVAATLPPEEFHQGDEARRSLDFFAPIVPVERQNPSFQVLSSGLGYSPARNLLNELMHYFEDVDGNFVKEFQSRHFDARLWELYLYALFTEIGYGFHRDHPAPDFHLEGPGGQLFVEATTVNPSELPLDAAEIDSPEYFEQYLPIRFAGVLDAKLRRKYWEQHHVAGHPLVFAVQDFQRLRSMSWSSTALVEYLYGIHQIEQRESDGRSSIVSKPVTSYKWREKEIAAGFFAQPGSENVSGVLANPCGTLSKFNRMGFLAGFGYRQIRMVREGSCYRGTLFPEDFVSEVTAPGYFETWCEGVSIYHNPQAKYPLGPDAFPCAAQHTMRDGRILSILPNFHPVGSITAIFTGSPDPKNAVPDTK